MTGPADPDGGAFPDRVTMVVLHCRDVAALRPFYRALGWPEGAGSDDALARFSLGPLALVLHPAGDPAAAPAPAGTTLVLPVARADGVDRAVADARAAGGRVDSEPADQDWGGRSAVFADPEGHPFEVLFVPGRPGPG